MRKKHIADKSGFSIFFFYLIPQLWLNTSQIGFQRHNQQLNDNVESETTTTIFFSQIRSGNWVDGCECRLRKSMIGCELNVKRRQNFQANSIRMFVCMYECVLVFFNAGELQLYIEQAWHIRHRNAPEYSHINHRITGKMKSRVQATS